MKRVLIFRHGSLGDTVVALPCFHLIARTFPNAERRLLSSVPTHAKAAAPSSILENTMLIHSYLNYDPKRGTLTEALRLWQVIHTWNPDVVVYLAEPRGSLGTWRDALFFKSCGVKTLIGVPYTKDLRENRWLAGQRCFEHEADRLARCLNAIGSARVSDRASWDLEINEDEDESAAKCLENWDGQKCFIVSSVAAKVKEKDWGKENWSVLFARLSRSCPSLGLAVVGARTDAEYSREVARTWQGPLLNLCGQLSLRETAAVMKQAAFYLGHDSGPMHLAAAAGVSCVALFLAPAMPGAWFPYGSGHQVIYHGLNGKNAAPVTVDEVFETIRHALREKHLSHV